MPLYEYQCQHCGYELDDVMQGFNDPDPICPGNVEEVVHEPCPMQKQMSRTTFKCLGKDWPDVESKKLKDRFVKRNKRIEKLPIDQQEGLKKVIDKTGGKRYIP